MRLNKLCVQEGLLRQIGPINFGERFIKAFAVEMAINLEETAPLFDAAIMCLWTISSTLPRKRGRLRFSIESILNYPF